MGWKKGRGLLGAMRPLLGNWVTTGGEGDGPASQVRCTREFTSFGKGWIALDARWQMGPGRIYRETAFFGAGEDGGLGFFSFTNDGKRSSGHPEAIAFEARMPAGLARMVYWPLADGAPGFRFAVESRTKKGWNRFLCQLYGPAG